MKFFFSILISLFILPGFLSASNDNYKVLDSLRLEVETVNLPKQKVETLIQASKVAIQLKFYTEALEFSEKAITVATNNSLKKEQVNAMLAQAIAYRMLNNKKKAFESASKAMELAELKSYTLEYAYASLFLSKVFFEIGEYDKSIELAYGTLDEFEKVEDYKELCDALNTIGVNYIENNNDSLAKKYLAKAIRIGKAHNLYSELGTSLGNLATIHGNNNEQLVAIDIQKQGCEILKNRLEETSNIGIGYYNIATGYLELNEPDSAYAYLKKAQVISQVAHNTRNLSIVYMGFARYYDYVKNNEKFLEYVNQAFAISDEYNFKFLKHRTSKMLEDYYFSSNKMDSAYKYKSIQFDLNKEFNSQNIATKLAQFEILKELEILEKERIFKQRQKTLYIIIVLIVLVSLLILLFVLLLRYRIMVRYSVLKQEKLEDEIYYKNKESTVSLMELMKKNELLADVTVELIKVSQSAPKQETKDSINKIALKIENITKEKIWDEFSIRFQQVHTDFYKNLAENFPDLTANDQRLCAFLKLNLSTKEISAITGQTERAIVMGRHRLRKNLGIQSQDTNLTSFISKF